VRLAQGRDKWWASVNTVVKRGVNIMSSRGAASFSERALLSRIRYTLHTPTFVIMSNTDSLRETSGSDGDDREDCCLVICESV
jgi:hypothetical protein